MAKTLEQERAAFEADAQRLEERRRKLEEREREQAITAVEKAGLLTRKVYAEVPPKVEYTLTEAGYNLRPVLEALSGWSARYFGSAQHRGKE